MKTFLNICNGRQVSSPTTFESHNPATGEVLGLVPISTSKQVAEAVAVAKAAQAKWAARPEGERKALLQQVADVLRSNEEYLAAWVTKEQGKPLGGVGSPQVPGSRFELRACEAWTRAPASLDLPVEVVFEDESRRDELHRRPFGVVAAITPWNWPLLIAIWKIVPSLRMGNTVVLKPSEHTSIATLEMVRLIAEVLPPGVLNTVSGGAEVGGRLVDDPWVDKIAFAGSGPTGSRIMAAAARNLTPMTIQLGGNDPAIVLPDANPKDIASRIFWGAFLNMGQSCACIKRLYVPDVLHDSLVAELRALAETTLMGNGLEPGMTMGPVQNAAQLDRIIRLVDEARAAGANVVCGGKRRGGPGYFYPITLVTDVDAHTSLVDEELLGPVLPIIKYREIEDAIDAANGPELGLGASVWSSDADAARAVAVRIQAGTVWINQHGMLHPMVPFGGMKGSGWGGEFGVEGLKDLTRAQVITFMKS